MSVYVFAGFPRQGLHAGGLQYAVETVEELALLEHDSGIQYRKEGVYQLTGDAEEQLYDVEYQMSDMCLRDGITWDWFPENWSFGNGVTVHKTLASPEFRTVVHGTKLTLDEFLATFGGIKLTDLELRRVHERTEGWEQYEARWLPGTCPQENHVVHLTWLISKYKLPAFAYERIRDLIENGAEPKELHRYSQELGKHFSESRHYNGKPGFGGGHAVPAVA